jgi:hypothetical protein
VQAAQLGADVSTLPPCYSTDQQLTQYNSSIRRIPMKKILGGSLLVCVICLSAFATKITLFVNSNTFIERAKDIVVAECISIGAPDRADEFQQVEINILKTLKGDRKSGRSQIATIYRMKPQTTYLLYSLGGNALGTDFLAIPELSVVPLPTTFKMDELEGKDLKTQVQFIFSRRLFELERELAPLLKEKGLLEKAVLIDERSGTSRTEFYR